MEKLPPVGGTAVHDGHASSHEVIHKVIKTASSALRYSTSISIASSLSPLGQEMHSDRCMACGREGSGSDESL